MNKFDPKWPQMGPRGFFPTNPDPADILGRTDFDFEDFYFWDFFGSQIFGPPDFRAQGPTDFRALGPGPYRLQGPGPRCRFLYGFLESKQI